MEKYSYYDVCQVLAKGTLEEIQRLCGEIGPNAFINKDKWTLLHAASIRGRSDIVQFLINLGSNVNALDKDEKSPLYYCKSEEGAKMLISAGANVNQASILGKTPLHYASLSNAPPSVVEVILQSGGQINAEDKFGDTPFLNACDLAFACIDEEEYETFLPKIGLLVKHHANIHHSNLKGENGLHICSQRGSYEIAEILLKSGVSVNAQSKTGQTPLFVACSCKYSLRKVAFLATIELLLKYGSNPTLADNQGLTPLHNLMLQSMESSVMSQADISSCVSSLIKSGASLNARDNMMRTPVHYACFSTTCFPRNWPDILSDLMTRGGDINAQDAEGFTPVMVTASHDRGNPTDLVTRPWDCIDGFESILEQVDWNCARKQGVTLAHTVLANKTLKFGGCLPPWDIDAQDEFLSTPMHYAEFTGNTTVNKYWWLSSQTCADLTLKDSLGNSAIDSAVSAQNHEMWVALHNYSGKSVVEKQRRSPLNNSCSLCANFNLESEIDSCRPFQQREEPISADPTKIQINMVANVEEYLFHILHTPRLGKVLQNAEVAQIQQETETLIRQILQRVANRDSRFRSVVVLLSGSVREKTKAGLPDEYDFMCNLEYFSSSVKVVDDGTCSPGFVRLEPIDDNAVQNISEFIDSNGSLVPYLVRSKLEELVRLAMFDSELWKSCRICSKFLLPFSDKGISHPKPSIIIELCWNGPHNKNMVFSVDLVPVIDVGPFWPKNANSSSPILEEVDKQCLFAMTIPRFELGVFGNEVRVSFSLVESAIFDRIPQVVKDAFITAKAVREICPRFVDSDATYSNSSLIPSYWLKMALFHELDKHGFDESSSLAVWVIRIYDRVYRYVCEEEVFPSFFMPQQDFIASKLKGRDKSRNLSEVQKEFDACQKLCQIIHRLLSRDEQRPHTPN